MFDAGSARQLSHPMCGHYASFLPAEAIARIFGTVPGLPTGRDWVDPQHNISCSSPSARSFEVTDHLVVVLKLSAGPLRLLRPVRPQREQGPGRIMT